MLADTYTAGPACSSCSSFISLTLSRSLSLSPEFCSPPVLRRSRSVSPPAALSTSRGPGRRTRSSGVSGRSRSRAPTCLFKQYAFQHDLPIFRCRKWMHMIHNGQFQPYDKRLHLGNASLAIAPTYYLSTEPQLRIATSFTSFLSDFFPA